MKTFQRYETALENKLFRVMHELERLQRMRQGERLPAPAVADVTVHADPGGLDSLAESADKNAVEGSVFQLHDTPGDLDPKLAPENGEAADASTEDE